MLYNIYSKILVGEEQLEITGFNSLIINNNLNELTDSCTILIPIYNLNVINGKTLRYYTEKETLEINIGDKITVELKVYKDLKELETINKYTHSKYFTGYIKTFNQVNDALEIICDDLMYLFKKTKLSVSEKVISLSDLINYVTSESKIDTTSYVKNYETEAEISLGKFKTEGFVNGAEIFRQIKDQYKYFFYFKNVISNSGRNIVSTPHFIAGLKYPVANADRFNRTINFMYPYSLENNDPKSREYFNPMFNNNLDYVNFDKTKDLIVLGVTTNSKTLETRKYATIDGKKILINGDKDDKKKIDDEANKRLLRIDFNINNIEAKLLQDLILEKWNTYPTSGFTGSFTIAGEPYVNIMDKVRININTGIGVDEFIEEVYFVDAVKTVVNETSGFTQEITLGNKVI